MIALENLIEQTGLTPYSFAKKHNIAMIYREKKKETFNFKRIKEIMDKEGITKLTFVMCNCDVEMIVK